jgi:hypothetical protein
VSWATTVQVAVDTKHHLIIMHEVTNVGTDRSQLAQVAKETKAMLETESMDVVADRGYFNSEEILACEEARITVTLPKAAKADDLELTSARAAVRAPRVATPPRRQAA